MSEFRLWVHEQFARLDGRRERRFVALAAALIFTTLALGPQAIRAVTSAANAPDIAIDELGTDPVAPPARFRATALNVALAQLQFLVQAPDGNVLTLEGQPMSAADPSRWESPPFEGGPGQTFVVKARGVSSANNVVVESSRPVTFSFVDPNAAQPVSADPTATTGTSGPATGTGTNAIPKTVDISFITAHAGAAPRIEARGLAAGFQPSSAAYRVLALTGGAFQGSFPATLDAAGTWHALFPVPGGALYRVVLVADDAGSLRESLPRDIQVPAPATEPVTQDPVATAPTATSPAPVLTLLLPTDGAESLSPVPLAARVANATATSLTFEILDPAGVTRTLSGGPDGAGNWNAMFIGLPGQYGARARATLTSGAVLLSGSFRPFRILAATEPAAAATTTPPTAAATTTAPTTVTPPSVELFAPAPDAPPFPGLVPISARVRDGRPSRVTAIVRRPDGSELLLAANAVSGDFWNANFDGPDGEYRFRVRATVEGQEHFSAERRFAVKRPVPASNEQLPPPPAPATALPPPPPPTAASATAPLPPPSTAAAPATTTPSNSLPAPRPISDVPPALAEECRAGGIVPERCADWLKAKYQSRECLEAGAITRESCLALLARLGMAADEAKVLGMAADEDLRAAAEAAKAAAGRAFAPQEMPEAIGRMLAFTPRPDDRWRVLGSRGEAPALLVLDRDGDDLPDDVERRFGTDPDDADSDGDGFSDGMEVKNGYNPLGGGTLEAPVRGVEKALLEGLALEEPRGAETLVDPAFRIAAAPAGDAAPAPEADVIRLSGTAAPNTVVTIFVYSYLPVVVTTTTDENGNWTYDFGSKLSEGRHEAYVSVNDDTGKLVAASSPLAFFVREAQAVTEEDFLRPDVNVEEAPAEMSRWFIYGGVALVALALFLVFAIIRQVRKSPMPDGGAGL